MEDLPNQTLNRPTVTLALIAKNEEKNVNRLLDSVEGCFDEIILVDTGSTDNTKALAEARGCKVYDFTWVESFCKARNFAFSKATCDYVGWLDLDDVLDNKPAFINWRDYAMGHADYWYATYDYAVDKDRKPIISFLRERFFKRSLNPVWQYDIHEGVIPMVGARQQYITTWRVKHLRDEDDVKQDRSRNIRMLDKMIKDGQVLDARMLFYYGKELYEAQRHTDSIAVFEQALDLPMQLHDRLLAVQYGGYACLASFDSTKVEAVEQRLQYISKAVDFALQGIKTEPNRAEFHVLAGDAYLRIGNIVAAVPYFSAAKSCIKNFDSAYAQPLFSFKNLYGEAPSVQLSKIYAHLGQIDKAKEEAKACIAAYNNEEAKNVLAELERITQLVTVSNNQTPCEDIVFTCPPQQAYEFDEELYKTKGMGGSETALIEMAKWLKAKTGRSVKIFTQRSARLIAESGVEYIPSAELNAYMSKNLPYRHIAWRHNIRCTNAPTYLWCHDLSTPTVEQTQNFDKFLALSEFHKHYTMGLQGVPEDKIIVTRNGLDPDKFKFERKAKNPNKLVWMSSPDRGLERCIAICEKVREEFHDVELHVYYGIEGLYKYGPHMAALADKLKVMMSERPWIKYHGFTEQSKMYQDVSDATVWVHPNDFIETFAITAIECLSNGIFPVVRKLGALKDTLGEAAQNRQAILLDYEWDDSSSVRMHANAVCRVILNKQWENLKGYEPNQHSWASVADEWIDFMSISSLGVAKVVS